jgi:hypothetical protein
MPLRDKHSSLFRRSLVAEEVEKNMRELYFRKFRQMPRRS